jgi:hypothetical protein
MINNQPSALHTVRFTPLLLVAALIPVFAMAAEQPVQHEVVSPLVAGAVQVDGRLDEPLWRQSQANSPLVTLGAMLAPAREQAQGRVMHTADTLYLGVECKSGPAAPMQELPAHDRRIYNQERVEIFLDSSPDNAERYIIVVDRRGNRRLARLDGEGQEEPDLSWGGQVAVAVSEIEGGWTAEIAIPFVAVGGRPAAADLYRLKICRDGGREGSLCWPPNPTSSFHTRAADGALYFEKMNLLTNGDFEAGGTDKPVPAPWAASLTSPEVNNADQGLVEIVAGAGVEGGRAVRKTKLLSALWWPQIWSPSHTLVSGAVYEFSVMARGTLPTVNLRANMAKDGRVLAKLSQGYDTPKEWQRLSFFFVVSKDISTVSVGLSAPSGISGEVFYDLAMLRRVLISPEQAAGSPAASYDPDPDPVQGLSAFMERSGVKPYDLFWRDGALLTNRLIFRDRKFGTETWMLDTSPTVDHCGTASVWHAWNANASALHVSGRRPVNEETTGGWLFNADYSRLTPHTRGIWDRKTPHLRYIHRSGQLQLGDTLTGEIRTIAEWKPYPRERIYGLTSDSRYAFLDTPNGGIWVTYQPGEKPIPRLGLYDGRPEAPGPVVLSRKHPDGPNVLHGECNCTTDSLEWGPLFRLRVGLLIDLQTGERQHVIAPLCGETEYLRTYMSGRVNFPQGDTYQPFNGPGWDKFRIFRSNDLDELFEMYRYFPHTTHGHESASPCGLYMAKDGVPRLIRLRDGKSVDIRLSPNGGNYHLHWTKHPRFFVGWVRGWSFGSFVRPQSANVEFQVFTDGTFQPIVDTKHRFNGYYSGGDFSMQSPDATKIHYGSSMSGRFRNYVAVMARPRPPQNVRWQPDGGAVALRWEPSPYSRETRGYLVYRSVSSGDGYELLTAEPVAGTSWRDATAVAGTPYYYVISSLEHSGLESGYSAEAARAGTNLPAQVQGPLVVYAEPEASIKDLDTDATPGLATGVDRLKASDWSYLYRHPKSERGEASLSMQVPAAGLYHLWGRVRSDRMARITWQVQAGGHSRQLATGESEWTWVKASEPVNLPAGPVEVTFATTDAPAQLDLLCLATDAQFVPQGLRPEKSTPPAAVAGLRAQNVRERVNHLTWQPTADPTLSHYQVYASTAPITAPDQALLVGSPTDPEFIDWGLKAGQAYYYAVTAVDRRGHESPLATARATTPAEPEAVLITLTFDQAQRVGPFEISEAGGTHGQSYLVPQDAPNNALSWQIEVPREGQYTLWLRYLHRGDGGRGGEVNQQVEVLLGDRILTTLGGGLTDLHLPDALIAKDHPLAEQAWTWCWPGNGNLERLTLPAGRHTLRLRKLTPDVRYDALVLASDPAWVPADGRLRQR